MSHIPVRHRDGDFQLRCEYCREWWPLDLEFWYPTNGLRRCKSCTSEYKKLKERGRRNDEAVRALKNTKARMKYAANRESYLAKNRAWRAANKERISAYNKAWRERHREKTRTSSAAYYEECRDVILAKKRQKYAEEKAA